LLSLAVRRMLTLALSWPRNCAEATIKDLGIVCVEAG
jgi:NAD(P)H-nitrite reductase large subunit